MPTCISRLPTRYAQLLPIRIQPAAVPQLEHPKDAENRACRWSKRSRLGKTAGSTANSSAVRARGSVSGPEIPNEPIEQALWKQHCRVKMLCSQRLIRALMSSSNNLRRFGSARARCIRAHPTSNHRTRNLRSKAQRLPCGLTASNRTWTWAGMRQFRQTEGGGPLLHALSRPQRLLGRIRGAGHGLQAIHNFHASSSQPGNADGCDLALYKPPQ